MYKLLYPTIRVRTGIQYRLGLGLVLVLRFCALKLITSNECTAQGVPSFELGLLRSPVFKTY